MHLYSALLCIAMHPKRFTIMWGVSPQPPPVVYAQIEKSASIVRWTVHNLNSYSSTIALKYAIWGCITLVSLSAILSATGSHESQIWVCRSVFEIAEGQHF